MSSAMLRRPSAAVVTQAAALCIACASMLPSAAAAASHTTDIRLGIIHDSDGLPIAAAAVDMLDAAGTVLAAGNTAADGTYAIDSVTPAAVRVQCEYCENRIVPYSANTEITVVRKRTIAVGPPAASDIAALPGRSIAALEELVPFAVRDGATVSDRGLRRGADATVFQGISLYRLSDNAPLSAVVPAGLIGGITSEQSAFLLEPFSADSPKIRAGSAEDLTVRSEMPTVRVAASRDARAANNAFAAAIGHDSRQLRLSGTVAAASASASAGSDAPLRNGASLLTSGISAESIIARMPVAATVRIVQSSANDVRESNAVFDIHATPLTHVPLRTGMRGENAQAIDAAAVQAGRSRDALYAATVHKLGRVVFEHEISADPRVFFRSSAKLPLSNTISLSGKYQEYPQTTPLFFGTMQPRAGLLETTFAITDHRRFSGEAVMYRERTASPLKPIVSGVGAALNFAPAPYWLIRTWFARAAASQARGLTGYADAPVPYSERVVERKDAQLVWITYDHGVRFDAVYTRGVPDFSAAVSLTSRLRMIAGTRSDGSRRAFVVEITQK